MKVVTEPHLYDRIRDLVHKANHFDRDLSYAEGYFYTFEVKHYVISIYKKYVLINGYRVMTAPCYVEPLYNLVANIEGSERASQNQEIALDFYSNTSKDIPRDSYGRKFPLRD